MLRCITPVDLGSITAKMRPCEGPSNSSTALAKNDRPLFVTLSAKAIGSMGFGLSILAIWLRWIVPQKAEEPKKIPLSLPRKRLRRRHRLSAPPQLPSSRLPSSNDLPLPDENRRFRRVYFEDEEPPRSPSLINEEPKAIPETAFDTSQESTIIDPSPALPVVHLLLRRETYEESIVESDGSSGRSSICHIPKIKSPFASKARRRSSSPDSPKRLEEAELGFKKPKKSNTFIGPWSTNRKGRPTVTLTEESSSVKSFTSLSPFRRSPGSRSNSIDSVTVSSTTSKPKPCRQPSSPAPIRRTLPYEAPYFATPPTGFHSRSHDNYSGKERRGRPAAAQTLPINRTRAIAKQRSSSLDITVRM